jgi:hypothetical protein
MLTQLRQVFLTRQSRQVTVEDQQQPMITIILQTMSLAVHISQFKRCGRLSHPGPLRARHEENSTNDDFLTCIQLESTVKS